MHTFRPTIMSLYLAATVLLATHAPASFAALLSLQPVTSVAAEGESISLDLVVSGLGDFATPSLGAFDATVSYDSTALTFTSYMLGNLLGDLSLVEAIDSSDGDLGSSVNVAEVSLLTEAALDALQPADFILATLTFDVVDLADGVTTQLSILRDALLVDAAGQQLDLAGTRGADVSGGSSVPLGSTLPLVFAGLLTCIAARRSRRYRK